jgi:hypothetical protein
MTRLTIESPSIYLIDVDRKCLIEVEVTDGTREDQKVLPRYITLSYV